MKVLILGLAYLVFVTVYVVSYESEASTAKQKASEDACRSSTSVLSAIQLVPYKLRAADLAPVVPTLTRLHNVEVTFFETDGRTTDRFSMRQETAVTFSGETNWVGYRVTFRRPTDVSVACLMTMNSFAFVSS